MHHLLLTEAVPREGAVGIHSPSDSQLRGGGLAVVDEPSNRSGSGCARDGYLDQTGEGRDLLRFTTPIVRVQYVGMMITGFPNLVLFNGPQSRGAHVEGAPVESAAWLTMTLPRTP